MTSHKFLGQSYQAWLSVEQALNPVRKQLVAPELHAIIIPMDIFPDWSL